MRIDPLLRMYLCGSAALVTAVGCSGAQTSPLSMSVSPTVQRASPQSLNDTERPVSAPDLSRRTYVSEGPGGINTILIYPSGKSNPAPIGKITKGLDNPVGMCLDTDGNLYVANIDGSDVTVYPKGKKTPSRTIAIGVDEPVSPVVGKDGTLYVSEYYAQAVLVFEKNKQKPKEALIVPGAAWGVALDGQNNLYVSYEGSDGHGHVEKFASKSTKGQDLGITVGRAVDLRIDRQGNIVLGDGDNGVVNVYAPGATSPTRQISIGQNPYMLALDGSEKNLYVTTTLHLLIFDYKSGAPSGTITNGLSEATGVALSPPAPL